MFIFCLKKSPFPVLLFEQKEFCIHFGFQNPVAAKLNWNHLSSGGDVIKLFFGGNINFPKIKKLNKVCSFLWLNLHKNVKQCYFELNYIRTLLICSKMAYSCCFSLGGNLGDFLDFLQKGFIASTTCRHFSCSTKDIFAQLFYSILLRTIQIQRSLCKNGVRFKWQYNNVYTLLGSNLNWQFLG